MNAWWQNFRCECGHDNLDHTFHGCTKCGCRHDANVSCWCGHPRSDHDKHGCSKCQCSRRYGRTG